MHRGFWARRYWDQALFGKAQSRASPALARLRHPTHLVLPWGSSNRASSHSSVPIHRLSSHAHLMAQWQASLLARATPRDGRERFMRPGLWWSSVGPSLGTLHSYFSCARGVVMGRPLVGLWNSQQRGWHSPKPAVGPVCQRARQFLHTRPSSWQRWVKTKDN